VHPTTATIERRRLQVEGRVQGVGFRPHVVRLAQDLALPGLVGNDSSGAFIEIEGSTELLDLFTQRLQRELPPLARISQLQVKRIEHTGQEDFVIVHSQAQTEQRAEVAPDVCICQDCARELLDPDDRRHHYPFINCTNCGPRYSIIRAIPYDRPLTSMASFPMCQECQTEYDDPTHRRYHAQPNACPSCGPTMWLEGHQEQRGEALPEDPIVACSQLLRTGKIAAIKGLGGFHLACIANDENTVMRLRERKGRDAKPFAIMVPSLEHARLLVHLDSEAQAALCAIERPIVILPKRDDAPIAPSVAHDLDQLGIMLPYTPQHLLLLQLLDQALVMTSANRSDEPLCYRNDEALERLSGLADVFLMHNRDVERPIDDSVRIGSGPIIRRARGFVPEPISIRLPEHPQVLALGADLKSTFCILKDQQAVLSEHLGELSAARTFRHYLNAIERLKELLRAQPTRIAFDPHPGYHSSRWARQLGATGRVPNQQELGGTGQVPNQQQLGGTGTELIPVQHHYAHLLSCMAEHAVFDTTLGIIADGTGYGDDGQVWGGELLLGDPHGFERVGQLEYVPLLGGDAAAEQPWRPAAALLFHCFGPEAERYRAIARGQWDEEAWAALRLRAARAKVFTSSLGRLFDAVSFILGLAKDNRYEAEAAMSLEAAARRVPDAEPLDYALRCVDGRQVLALPALLVSLMQRLAAGESSEQLALAFHLGVCDALAEMARRVAVERKVKRVALSGGCFANEILRRGLHVRLEAAGFEVLEHSRVPPGDGGLSLGQALAAACIRPA
jgi:hydrogenase maturation protein HypF